MSRQPTRWLEMALLALVCWAVAAGAFWIACKAGHREPPAPTSHLLSLDAERPGYWRGTMVVDCDTIQVLVVDRNPKRRRTEP